MNHKPLAYIEGEVEFYHNKIKLNQNVLIPRQESEILIFYALERLKNVSEGTLLDLCTGSGCLGLAIKKAKPLYHVILSDISPKALEVAKENATLNGLDVEVLQGDLFESVKGRKFDFLVCNPPYVTEDEYEVLEPSVKDFEPKLALVAKDNGLYFYKKIAEEIPSFLNSGGLIFFEIGKDQGQGVMSFFDNPRWKKKEVIKDWAGHDRFVFIESC
jgi:release factor glutamine methyltransferase